MTERGASRLAWSLCAVVVLAILLDQVLYFVTPQEVDTGSGSYGTGMLGMADRLAALDGSLEVRSAPGDGTTIAGSLPAQEIPA